MKMKKSILRLTVGVLLTLAPGVYAATAGDAALTDSGTGTPQTFTEPFTLGYQISFNQVETVYALGVYDGPNGADGTTGDGLINATSVSLYSRVGGVETEIASATVPEGTDSTLIGDYRYVELATPVTLPLLQLDGPGYEYYTVGAYYPGGTDDEDLTPDTSTYPIPTDPSVASSVTRVYAVYAEGDSEPTSAYGAGAYVGPNLLLSPITDTMTSIPEPSTFAYLILGAAVLLFVLRRKGINISNT